MTVREPFALTHATLVTGDADGTVLPDRTVVVGSTGHIERVEASSEVSVPPECRTIDSSGRYVVPGLINAHAHLFADGRPLPSVLLNRNAAELVSTFTRSPVGHRFVKQRAKSNVITQLLSGVTTLRSLGDVGYEVVAVGREIARGEYLGPRVIASGPLHAISGGHGAPQIALVSDSPRQARHNVRHAIRHGVSATKIAATGGVTDSRAIGEAGRPQMTEEEMSAICEEAHKAGILVAAHAQSSEGIAAALRAGVDTIEHGAAMTPEMVDLFHRNPRSLHGSSSLVPTLQACLPLVKLDGKVTGTNDIVRENAATILREMLQGIREAREHGITIGMGTDSGLSHVTHYNTWRELDYLTRYGGLSSAAALHAATQANATLLGIADVTGSVDPGKSADLVVLDANPLEGFRAFTSPTLVIVGGAVINAPTVTRHTDIDARLDGI